MRYYKIVDEETVFFTGNILVTDEFKIINPTQEQMLAAGWLIYEEPEPSQEELLAKAKEEKITQIEMYDSSENVEQFVVNGVPMWLGHEVRQQIRTSADAYEALGSEAMTKIFNGVEFTFSIAQWRQMLNELEVYAAEALNTTERHKATVYGMTTVQSVIDYDYTTDYPTKLIFGEED